MDHLKQWMSSFVDGWLVGEDKRTMRRGSSRRPLLLGDDDRLGRGMSSALSPFAGGPDILEERLPGVDGPSEERVDPVGTIRVEYLDWYRPPKDEGLSFYQETMAA